ncbi:MAG TPA: SpoIIE family protein phosphatase [Candidatus Limnocylindrales bacterium]|nr:SpoIIE family protein phosphatase [Candidatus Limnocylindrales bacterium]
MRAPRLERLIERAGLDALLEAASAIAPGIEVRILGGDGAEITRSPATDERSATTTATASVRPLVVDGNDLGSVAVRAGDEAAARSIGELVGQAIELAATEGLGRRMVAAAAVDDLRELALLSRLSETLGSAVDPAGIADCVLSTVSRPLGPAVGFVLGPDDATMLAVSGPPDDIAALRADAASLVASLRAENPTIASCAAVGTPSDHRFGTILAAFLRTARGHHGTIVLGRDAGAGEFTAADRQLLASVAGQAAIAIERAGLQRQIVERRALDEELAIGRRIQLSLMPRRFPTIEGWEIASAYEPAREVGGDFYDVFRLRDRGDCVGLVVADVTGKGIPAAILMADTRGLIHAAADHSDDPAETLARVNRILVDERASGLFVTVVHAVLDPRTGRLVLARAGHDPVHLLRADGRLEVLVPPGRLIGMVADLGVTSVELRVEPGDAFVGHTDGITEARAPDGSFYGEDRFRALLAGLAGTTAAGIVAAVTADVASFRGRAEPSDDLTLLVVRRQPAAAG